MPVRSSSRYVRRAAAVSRPRFRRSEGAWVSDTIVDATVNLALAAATPIAKSLTAAIETEIGQDIRGATLHRLMGELQLVITPTAASPTFTRGFAGFGILWESEDMLTDDLTDARVPSPFDDSYRWIWRRFRQFNFAATNTTANSDADKIRNYVPVMFRGASKQPTSKHRLWLCSELTNVGQANLGSVTFGVMVNVGLRTE